MRAAVRRAGGHVWRGGGVRRYSASTVPALSVVIIDSRVLLGRSAGGDDSARRRRTPAPRKKKPEVFTSAWLDGLLNKEVRTQLKDLGLESTGKPWVIRERLEKAMPAAAKGALGGGRKPVDNPPDIRAKYAEKLAQRKQGGGRAEDISRAAPSSLDGLHVSTTGVLDYLRGRGIHRVLLPSHATFGGSDPARREQAVAALVASCGPHPFEFVMDPVDPSSAAGGAALLGAARAVGGPGIEAHEALVLCADEPLVAAAKAAGAHTAFVDGVAPLDAGEARRARYAAGRTLDHLRDVQWVIEDFNGISHRLSVRDTSMDMFDR